MIIEEMVAALKKNELTEAVLASSLVLMLLDIRIYIIKLQHFIIFQTQEIQISLCLHAHWIILAELHLVVYIQLLDYLCRL